MDTTQEFWPIKVPPIHVYVGMKRPFLWAEQFEDDDSPRDLTGWHSWAAAWRPSIGSEEVISLPVVVDHTAGRVSIVLTSALARVMAGRSGVWDVEALDPEGEERTWFNGTTSSEMDVTRL